MTVAVLSDLAAELTRRICLDTGYSALCFGQARSDRSLRPGLCFFFAREVVGVSMGPRLGLMNYNGCISNDCVAASVSV